MKLLMAIAGAAHGGAETFFERLAPAFAARDVEVRTVIRENMERRLRLQAAGVAVSEARFGGPFDLATGRAFGREVAGFRPRVVLTFMSRAARYCPKPRGRFVHVGRLGGYYPLKYYRRCHALVANTEDIRRFLIDQGASPETVYHIPNFVDARSVAPTARQTYQTPTDAPLLVALGRFHENKAFDVLLQALADVPEAVLWLAGAGPLEEELMSVAARAGVMGRVRLLGWQSDTAPLIEAADVVVVPSRREPLGNVVLEAWARTKPVVAAASEGPSHLIAEGDNGLLVPIDDADALAAAVNRVIGDPSLASALGQAGRARYDAGFSERQVVDQWLDLFARLQESLPRGNLR